MAWLSIGTCNEDLCNKMVQHGVLKEGSLLLEAFQRTDRGNFVPAAERSQAYLDRPFKSGSIHISAPHMYVTVLEALDLQRGNSFLNVGSGSGYLSCLASYLLGGVGICHGIEISASAVEHSRMCTKSWIEQFSVGGVFSLPTSSHSRYLGSEESIRFIHSLCLIIVHIILAIFTLSEDFIFWFMGFKANMRPNDGYLTSMFLNFKLTRFSEKISLTFVI